MESMASLTQNHHITINDVDFTKKMKLSSAFNYFQEIANNHSFNLGIGISHISESFNVTWVLIKIRVDILRYPVWDEEIVVKTWPHIPKRYEFDRDFTISDMNGNIIAKCVSTWVLLDLTSRELRKSEVITADYHGFHTERAIDCTLGKIRLPEEFEMVYKRMIGCSDIDMNGHLNNSKYVDFIMDCFSMEQLKKNQASSLQVNYLNEALPGDTIIMYRHISPTEKGRVYIKGIREGTGENIFTATMITSPITAISQEA